MTNLKKLLSTTEGQFGLKAAGRLGNKLAKTGLLDLPLTGAVEEKDRGPGINVETEPLKGQQIEKMVNVIYDVLREQQSPAQLYLPEPFAEIPLLGEE